MAASGRLSAALALSGTQADVRGLRMEKDVFIVHTRRYRLQRTLYDYLSTQARKCNFQVLNYNDWEWETPVSASST